MNYAGLRMQPPPSVFAAMPCCSACSDSSAATPRQPGADLVAWRLARSTLVALAPELAGVSRSQGLVRPRRRAWPVDRAFQARPADRSPAAAGPGEPPRHSGAPSTFSAAERAPFAWAPPVNGGGFSTLTQRAQAGLGRALPRGGLGIRSVIPGCHLAGPDSARLAQARSTFRPQQQPPAALFAKAASKVPPFRVGPLSGAWDDGTAEDGLVDIYFSAGTRSDWGDPRRYRSCDDGVDTSCELWRVRWSFARQDGHARRVRSQDDERALLASTTDADGYTLPVALTVPAVNPSGDTVAYKVQVYGSGQGLPFEMTDPLDEMDGGTRRVKAAYGTPPAAWRETSIATVAEEPDFGGVGWPAFLGDDTLLTGSEFTTRASDGRAGFDASFKSVYRTPLAFTSDRGGKWLADGARVPVVGPAVAYEQLGYTDPDPGLSGFLGLLGEHASTDPHAHEHVTQHGVDVGRRAVAFGELHWGDPDASFGTPRVFDPDVQHLTDADVDEAEVPFDGGCHHPSWSLAGDRFQCSHQQGAFKVSGKRPYEVTRRTLHGFRWLDVTGKWQPWRRNGELFPSGMTGADTEAWYLGLPGSLTGNAESAFVDVWPDSLDSGDSGSEPHCGIITWKYGAFCGTDDYVVAMLSCSNDGWGGDTWTVEDFSDPEDVSHMAHIASRIVLIRLSDGYHWDLTSRVARALGTTESKDPLNAGNIFGIYPTCGPMRQTSTLGIMTLNQPASGAFPSGFTPVEAVGGTVDEGNPYA